MKEGKAKILLHPVRMRVIQTLVTGEQLTVSEMLERLPDIPQATLYRHLKKLVDSHVLKITQETKVRGAVEKVYALAEHGASLSKDEIQSASREEHLDYFMNFISHLLGNYSRYLDQKEFDLFEDGVMYRQVVLHLSEAERNQLIHDIGTAYSKVLKNTPSPDRNEYNIATVIIPEPKK